MHWPESPDDQSGNAKPDECAEGIGRPVQTKRDAALVLVDKVGDQGIHGAVRMPLPIRSAIRTPKTNPQELAKYKSGLVNADRA